MLNEILFLIIIFIKSTLIETIDMTISQHINSDVRIIRTIQISDKVKLVWKSYNN